MADMNGQVALVTGGIRGIGLAICERLMNRGVKVAAGYASNADAAQLFADKYARGVMAEPDGRHAWLRLTPDKLVSWDFRKLAALPR